MAIKMMTDKSVYTCRDNNGKPHYRAQLIADTAAELAGVTEQGGVVWDFGSIAHAIDDAQILRLDSNDDWVIQTGDNAGQTVDEVIAAASVQSSPKSAQSEQRKTVDIDLEKVLDEDDEEERRRDEHLEVHAELRALHRNVEEEHLEDGVVAQSTKDEPR